MHQKLKPASHIIDYAGFRTFTVFITSDDSASSLSLGFTLPEDIPNQSVTYVLDY